MALVTITADGDHVIAARGDADAERSVITVEANSAATLTWGYQKTDGTFQAWPTPSFDVSDGFALNHGQGVVLMVRVADIGDPVVLNVRP
jgi:hypothetical protein